MNKRDGFTIIELMVVVSIIGLLSSIALANFQGAREKAKNAVALSFQSSVKNLLGAETAAAWNFDNGAVGVPVGIVNDDSGNNFSGTVGGVPPGSATYVNGQDNGKGVFLNNGAYIVGTSNIGSTANAAVTVTAWISPTNTANTTNIFQSGGSGCNSFQVGIQSGRVMIGNQAQQVNIALNKSGRSLASIGGEPPAPAVIEGPANVANNTWQFITASFDPSGDARIYVNGVLTAEIPNLPTTDCPPSTSVWMIGGTSPGSAESFSGIVDNVAVYNASLSPSAVSKLYQEGLKNHLVAMH